MNSPTNKPKDGKARRVEQQFGTNSEIARRLRTYYGSLVTDDVPDRFTQLLSQLESAEAAKKKD